VGSGNDGWAGRAFGLRLAGTLRLEGVVASSPGSQADTWLERAPRADVDGRWRAANPHTVVEHRLMDGSVGMSVQRDDKLGFRIWAPRHGCYLVAPNGRNVLAAPPSGPAWRWERLVLAQVLPLAAVLRGKEILHASAVALSGQAVAFMGVSGAGKTTLAGRLAARGAQLVTDDVLALDLAGATVRAHRGSALARIDPAELRTLPPAEREALGPVRARGEKWHIAPPPARDRMPLGLTYHLARASRFDGVQLVRVDPYDPALLLGNAFLPYLRDAGRLRRQLDVCSAIARDTPLYQVRVGATAGSAQVAEAVHAHARSLL
jgi:hypothetical protein